MTKLEQLIACIYNTHVYIQMHNYPDQDSIGSAFGLKHLLKAKGVDSTLIYHGIIDKCNTDMYRFYDIRSNVGACASIYCQLLF